MEQPRYRDLDGLRALCAILVFVGHLGYGLARAMHDGREEFYGLGISFLGAFAHVAVLVFFVLSGFVIGITTNAKCSGLALEEYGVRRFLRIVPIYVVAVAFGFAVSKEHVDLQSLLIHLGFLHVWLAPTMSGNGPLWTLHYEAMFYLLFPFVWRLDLSPLKCALVCSVLAIVSIFWPSHLLKLIGYFGIWLIGVWMARNREKLADESTLRSWIWVPLFFVSAAYFQLNIFSVLLGKYTKPDIDGMLGVPHIVTEVLGTWPIALIVAAGAGLRLPGAIFALLLVVGSTLTVVSYGFAKGLIGVRPEYWVTLLLLALAVISAASPLRGVSWLARMAPLAGVSYGLYVLHAPILNLAFSFIDSSSRAIDAVLVTIGGIASTFLTAYLLEQRIQPLIVRGVRRYRTSRAVTS